jgi:hypothetical protein
METKKTYKYKVKETGNEFEAVLVKGKDRCYLYLDKNQKKPTASWNLERYDDFNFYCILEPFTNPDKIAEPTKEDILDYLKITI